MTGLRDRLRATVEAWLLARAIRSAMREQRLAQAEARERQARRLEPPSAGRHAPRVEEIR